MKKFLLFIIFSAALLAKAQKPVSDEALAMQYYQLGEFDKAAVIFDRLFNTTKNDAYFELYLTTLLKIKNYTDAEKVAKRMTTEKPANPVYAIALGRVYTELGKKAAADKLFEDVIANLPKEEFRIREAANAFYRFESYDNATRVFLQGRKLLNNETLFTFDLLGIYRFKKDKEMLVQEYVAALANTPELLPQAQNAFATVFEGNADYQVLQGLLLKQLQKFPDKEVYTDLLIWQFMQQKEFDMALRQLIAQDKRLKGNGAQLYNAAALFIDSQNLPAAIKTYEYILTKGKTVQYYLPARLELINTKYLLATAGKQDLAALKDLVVQYDSVLVEFGKTPQTIFAMKRLANLQAYYLDNPAKAQTILEEALTVRGIPATEIGNIKLSLGDIYVITDQPWEAVLTYQQVAKQFENSAIGNDANYKVARLSFYQGNFEFAKSQADVLKASTSQLIANDALNLSLLISDNLQSTNDSLALKMYADAEMLEFRNLTAKAVAKLDSIAVKYPGNSLEDDVLMAKSRIFIKGADFTAAAAMLTKLTEGFSDSIWADDALFSLAELNETKLQDTEKAKTLYQKLITDHPGSMFTAEARKRFRVLRGDAM